MNKIIIMALIILVASQITHAQEMGYVSNLGQSSSENYGIGNNSWYAAEFRTGSNTGGYSLDSVQLAMTDASGNPSGFTVMVYSAVDTGGPFPGSSLDTLTGSLNPTSADIYTYTPDSSLTLLPSTHYFIVLTGGTAVANGAYQWNEGGNYTQDGGWLAFAGPAFSSNGSNWGYVPGYPRYAITATAIPEPGVLSLFATSCLNFLWQRRRL